MKKIEIKITDVQKKGIKAIIFLQKMAGITETEEKALTGWNSLQDYEKEFTLNLWEAIKKKSNK